MEDEFIEDIKSQDKLRITQLQITCDDSVQMKKQEIPQSGASATAYQNGNTKSVQGSGYLEAGDQGAREPIRLEERGDKGDHRRPRAGGGCGRGAGPLATEATTTGLALGAGAAAGQGRRRDAVRGQLG